MPRAPSYVPRRRRDDERLRESREPPQGRTDEELNAEPLGRGDEARKLLVERGELANEGLPSLEPSEDVADRRLVAVLAGERSVDRQLRPAPRLLPLAEGRGHAPGYVTAEHRRPPPDSRGPRSAGG